MARHRLLPKARYSGSAVVQGVALAGLTSSLIRPEFLVRGKALAFPRWPLQGAGEGREVRNAGQDR